MYAPEDKQNAVPARFHFFTGALAIFAFFLYNKDAIFRNEKNDWKRFLTERRRALHISDHSAFEPMLDIGVVS